MTHAPTDRPHAPTLRAVAEAYRHCSMSKTDDRTFDQILFDRVSTLSRPEAKEGRGVLGHSPVCALILRLEACDCGYKAPPGLAGAREDGAGSGSEYAKQAPSRSPSETELKACPFCGGEAVRKDIEDQANENFGASYICCKRCWATTALHFDRKENLVSAWNERVAPTPPVQETGEVENLRAALKEALIAHTACQQKLAQVEGVVEAARALNEKAHPLAAYKRGAGTEEVWNALDAALAALATGDGT